MFLPRLDFNPRFDYFSYNFVLKLKKKLCFQTISRFLTVETNIQTTSSCLVPTENQEMLVNFDIIFLKRKHFGLQVHACWPKTTPSCPSFKLQIHQKDGALYHHSKRCQYSTCCHDPCSYFVAPK